MNAAQILIASFAIVFVISLIVIAALLQSHACARTRDQRLVRQATKELVRSGRAAKRGKKALANEHLILAAHLIDAACFPKDDVPGSVSRHVH